MKHLFDHDHDHGAGQAPSSTNNDTGAIGAGSFDPTSLLYGDPRIGITKDGWHGDSSQIGQGVTVTYAFANTELDYMKQTYTGGYTPGYTDYQAWTEAQKGLAQYALDLVQSYTNINFVISTDPNTADMTFHSAEMGKRGDNNEADLAGGGWPAVEAGNQGDYPFLGDVIIDTDFIDNDAEMSPGQYSHMVMLHEIGHTLGMIDILTTMDIDGIEQHHRGNTIMSYRDSIQTQEGGGASDGANGAERNAINPLSYEPETYMVYDILTLQYLYGVNTTFAAGNNVYDLGTNGQYWDRLHAIWDAGGNDTLDARGASESVLLSLIDGSYSSVGNVENFGIAFNAIIENAYGSAFDDILIGNDVANLLMGNGGDDFLEGGAGNDRLHGGQGSDDIHGDEGNDTIYHQGDLGTYDGGAGTDTVNFSRFDKAVWVGLDHRGGGAWHKQDHSLYTGTYEKAAILTNIENVVGSQHQDAIYGDANNNSIYGQAGDDFLFGKDGDDHLLGQVGDDYVDGGDGDDNISGGLGNDHLYGQSGADTINGGDGDDNIYHQGDLGTYDGGDGEDTISFSDFNKAVWVGLDHHGGGAWHKQDHSLYTGTYEKAAELKNIENIVGSQHQDAIYGDANDNALYGQDGNDYLSGKAGTDRVFGENGDDFIYASTGNDLLYGGAGADMFIFNISEAFNGVNRIMDFSSDDGDMISLGGFLDLFDEVTEAISDFIFLTQNATDTFINIDLDGNDQGQEAQQLTRIHNTADDWNNIDDMIAQGDINII